MNAFEEWRSYRERSVAGFQGDLSLAAMHVIADMTAVAGLPGLWAPAPQGGLILTASELDGISVDDVPAEGTVHLRPDVSVVRFSGSLAAQATSQPGSDHLLAVWDSEAEALQDYEGIDAYPHRSDWIVEARFDEDEPGREVSFEHTSDGAGTSRRHRSPGDILFEREGTEYRLRPFASGDSLILVFGDKTNGEETYGRGRMLIVPEADARGKTALDFNRAFLPPCAFSPHFNCPLPPAGNRLPFAVPAGEKQIRRQAHS
ncbi:MULTISPECIES: DUF1684 domain-containing protein [unclassified Paenibacillus]|uniref:DUF1684 domain-containing protein n=1 Tax=unclassified Paenibacillus TaxID=185978 RepID=UPI0009567F0C|nr:MULTISPECIES: DUF1684 domain-containing protein [unclassified Paenibacillus]ASS67786.1 DUF1684 domain-containing protein [Paenibacillus sp. RUD330]SIR60793.1 hypothetical protein SAMN05880555_4417 [Paenibacillus sp. RU4X]SIR69525.1 hypothetical protein SAMN05880570_4419 [Paenibacillus sp. RU4T]